MSEDIASTLEQRVIDEAIRQHVFIAVTADSNAPDIFDRTFVEYGGVLASLGAPDWQVVFGAPGTGKTMLLRVLQEREKTQINDEPRSLPHAAILPIYVNAGDVVVMGLRSSKDYSDEKKAEAYFRQFLERLSSRLGGMIDTLKGDKRRKHVAKEILEICMDIDAIVNDPGPNTALLERQYESETSTMEHRGRLRGAAVDFRFGFGTTLRGDVSGQVRGGKSLSDTTKRTIRESTSMLAPRLHKLRERLETFVEKLGLHRIDILLDNWSDLDDSGQTNVQPAFAQLLADAFGKSHAISVKIAADRYNCRLFNSGTGLQLDREIFVAANLNGAVLDDRALVRFFENLLFHRMHTKVTSLGVLIDKDRPETVSPAFIDAIFENVEVFTRLVKGCEGRPRLFLQTFNYLAQLNSYSSATRWTVEHVRKALPRRDHLQSQEIEYWTKGVQFLLVCVKSKVLGRNHAVFLLQPAVAEGLRPHLDELMTKSLIHEISTSKALVEPVSLELRCFAVSQWLIVEWEERAASNVGDLDRDAPAEILSGPIPAEDVPKAMFAEADVRPWLSR